MPENFRLALHRHPVLGPLLRFGNRWGANQPVWSSAKRWVKGILFPPAGHGEAASSVSLGLLGYALGLRVVPHLMVPTRIVSLGTLPIHPSILTLQHSPSEQVVLQRRFTRMLIDAVKEAMERGDEEQASRLIWGGVALYRDLWRCGVCDIDLNLFPNYAVTDGGEIKIVDAGGLSENPDDARSFITLSSSLFLGRRGLSVFLCRSNTGHCGNPQ